MSTVAVQNISTGSWATVMPMMSTSDQRLAVPNELGSPDAKLVYLALLVNDDASVTDLQELLGLSKLTLLPILSSLVATGLARYTEGRYASR